MFFPVFPLFLSLTILFLFIGGSLLSTSVGNLPKSDDRCEDLFQNIPHVSDLSVSWFMIDSLGAELLFDRTEGQLGYDTFASPEITDIVERPQMFVAVLNRPTVTFNRAQALLTGSLGINPLFEKIMPKMGRQQRFVPQISGNIFGAGSMMWTTFGAAEMGPNFTPVSEDIRNYFMNTNLVMEGIMPQLNTNKSAAFILVSFSGLDLFCHNQNIDHGTVYDEEFAKITRSYVTIKARLQERVSVGTEKRNLFVLFSDHGHESDGNHFQFTPRTSNAILITEMLNPNHFVMKPIVRDALAQSLNQWSERRKGSLLKKKRWVAGERFRASLKRAQRVKVTSQVDLTPTTAMLLRTAIPSRNLGVIIPEVVLQAAASYPGACKGVNDVESCIKELEQVVNASMQCNARQFARSHNLKELQGATVDQLWNWLVVSSQSDHLTSHWVLEYVTILNVGLFIILLSVLAPKPIRWKTALTIAISSMVAVFIPGVVQNRNENSLIVLFWVLCVVGSFVYNFRSPITSSQLRGFSLIAALLFGSARYYNSNDWGFNFRIYALFLPLIPLAVGLITSVKIVGWKLPTASFLVLIHLIILHKPSCSLFFYQTDKPFIPSQLRSIIPETLQWFLLRQPTLHIALITALGVSWRRRSSRIATIAFAVWSLSLCRVFEFPLRLGIITLFISLWVVVSRISKRIGCWAGGFILFVAAIVSYALEYHHSTFLHLHVNALDFGLPIEFLPIGVINILTTTFFPLLAAGWAAVHVDRKLDLVTFGSQRDKYGVTYHFLALLAARMAFLVLLMVLRPRPLEFEQLLGYAVVETGAVYIGTGIAVFFTRTQKVLVKKNTFKFI